MPMRWLVSFSGFRKGTHSCAAQVTEQRDRSTRHDEITEPAGRGREYPTPREAEAGEPQKASEMRGTVQDKRPAASTKLPCSKCATAHEWDNWIRRGEEDDRTAPRLRRLPRPARHGPHCANTQPPRSRGLHSTTAARSLRNVASGGIVKNRQRKVKLLGRPPLLLTLA